MNADGRPSQLLLNAQKELLRRRELTGVSYRPPTPSGATQSPADWIARLGEQQRQPAEQERRDVPLALPDQQVRLSPTLAAICLNRQNRHHDAGLDAPYRLYKIMQVLDRDGRGWLTNQSIVDHLTRKKLSSFIYGRRQLKIVLRRGEGLFWNRVKVNGAVHIRLVSRTKLAAALGCDHLHGREVAFSLKLLLGSGRGRQAAVNAALYAAVHAGQIQGKKQKEARPITRSRIGAISGCSNYRQRSYEQRMQIKVGRNIHIIGRYSDYGLNRARIHYHLPAYKHTDFLGKINRHQRGADYIAVRLGNNYQAPQQFTVVHSRRQRTINRHLAGLRFMGSEGSGRTEYVRLYHENAASAVRFYNRDPQTAAFWPLTNKGGPCLWRKVG